MKINVYDILVFEDKNKSIYQDCVCSITRYDNFNNPYSKNERYSKGVLVCLNSYFVYVEDIGNSYVYNKGNLEVEPMLLNDRRLKEIWTKTDEDTYKKIYELVDDKLTEISYGNGLKVYHKRQEVTYDQLRNFEAKEN